MSTERNVSWQAARRTQSRGSALSLLTRVRERSKADPHMRFDNLYSQLTVPFLRESFHQLKRRAQPGVDGMTWSMYAANLERNLQQLHERLHTGRYRAQPVLRRYIPKGDGRERPLGITTVEDKLVQQACASLLEAVFVPHFAGFSYGFRKQRNQHDALDALNAGLVRRKIRYVLDADIKGFFDAIDHGKLMTMLRQRIRDPRLLRLIRKWMKTGHVEGGRRHRGTRGTPQGGVISPLLGNIYLHYVLDEYAHWWRATQATGDMIIIRYADDFVVGFQHRHEAERFRQQLADRFAIFKLSLHAEKTRLIEFGRFAWANRRVRGEGRPETFDFLGFTHCCAETTTGKFWVRRLTVKKRMRATLQRIKDQLRWRMHDSIKATSVWLRQVVTGYLNYHAVPGNLDRMRAFRTQVMRYWQRAIRRRSQKGRKWNWDRFNTLLNPLIPQPSLRHPFPLTRFDATTRGRSRMR